MRRAAAFHPDRYARDMAAQVLLDAGVEPAAEASMLRGTA